jgi:hypothetical protein
MIGEGQLENYNEPIKIDPCFYIKLLNDEQDKRIHLKLESIRSEFLLRLDSIIEEYRKSERLLTEARNEVKEADAKRETQNEKHFENINGLQIRLDKQQATLLTDDQVARKIELALANQERIISERLGLAYATKDVVDQKILSSLLEYEKRHVTKDGMQSAIVLELANYDKGKSEYKKADDERCAEIDKKSQEALEIRFKKIESDASLVKAITVFALGAMGLTFLGHIFHMI